MLLNKDFILTNIAAEPPREGKEGQIAPGPQAPRGLIIPNASTSDGTSKGPYNTQCFKV